MMTKKLSEISKIEISGVDKKSKPNEEPVKLLNFTDVYYNWQVDSQDADSFMKATANKNEIEKFSVQNGDVVITKDSETRDDIGMSCLVDDKIDNTILGYHCALIRPNIQEVDSGFLNAYLSSSMARKYFSNQASGSGQRYTLTVDGIGEVKIPLFDMSEQKKISMLIGSINRKIKLNNRINDNLQQLITIIYQRWFFKFDFPIGINSTYVSNGGKLTYSKFVNREIPENWTVKKLCESTNMYQPESFDAKKLTEKGKYCVYGAGGFMGYFNNYNHEKSEILISCRGSCGNIYRSLPNSMITGNAMIVHPNDLLYSDYLFWTLKLIGVKNCITGSVQPQITRENLNDWYYVYPPKEIIENFNKIANQITSKIFSNEIENIRLTRLRDFLLPILMNGQAAIAD